MKHNKLIRNIAAVSLIEIMMIFAIIGVVTTACAALSKPKLEYMKKIKLYSALVTLEQASKAIVQEGSIDYTTDIGTCKDINNTTYQCQDYGNNLSNVKNQLPKVSHRDATNNADAGINNTYYANLNNNEKIQYKYLQNGFCQRLASAIKLQPASINCSATISADGLINDSSAYTTSFYGITPQLYLPNGQVVYIGKNLYTDFRASNGNITRKVVVSNNLVTNGSITYEQAYIDASWIHYYLGDSQWTWINDELGNFGAGQIISLPNETRLGLFKSFIDRTAKAGASITNYAFLTYLQQAYKNNKDYYIVYVDTDCKKSTGDDKQCGSDTLNDDVYAFRVYGDGTVLPDYQSGFPTNLLTAKVLVKGNNGRYTVQNSYTMKPLTYAMCYANLVGAYSSGYANEHTGICGSIGPLAGCYSDLGETQCKVIINKPSFVMR